MVLYAIIRIRGTIDVPPKIKETLRKLNLTRKFSATIYPKSSSLEGMLKVVKDWVTWGEIDESTLKELILRKGELQGGKKISEESLKSITGKGIDELVKDLLNGRMQWHKLAPAVKPVFRLHPPKKGFKGSIRKPFNAGGELGYRGSEINHLILRMI